MKSLKKKIEGKKYVCNHGLTCGHGLTGYYNDEYENINNHIIKTIENFSHIFSHLNVKIENCV